MIVSKEPGCLSPRFSFNVPARVVGAIALVFALIGIACASILVVVVQSEISPYATTFNRLFIATPVFFVWHSLQHEAKTSDASVQGSTLLQSLLPSCLGWSDSCLIVLSGLAFSGSLSLWAWSLTQTSVANATLLDNMLPIFTTLGGWLLFRETFSKKFLLGMGVAIAGVVIIGLEDFQVADGGCFVGDIAAMGASLLAAVNILCIERLRPRYSAPWIMMWTSFIGSLFIAGILLILQDGFVPSTLNGWAAVLALAIISQVLGQGLLTYALKEFSAGLVTVSVLAIPVIAALMAVVAFSETLSLINWCAFGVVLIGIYISVSAQITPNNQSLPIAALESADNIRDFQDIPHVTSIVVTGESGQVVEIVTSVTSLDTGELATPL